MKHQKCQINTFLIYGIVQYKLLIKQLYTNEHKNVKLCLPFQDEADVKFTCCNSYFPHKA